MSRGQVDVQFLPSCQKWNLKRLLGDIAALSNRSGTVLGQQS